MIKSDNTFLKTPIGRLRLQCNNTGLLSVRFQEDDDSPQSTASEQNLHALLQEASRQLVEYFNGNLFNFSLPLALVGTDFQCRVWQETLQVPFGETASYKDLAANAGSPGAFRAVGQAMHKNPLPIFIPCHRVIGSTGSLTGFSAGLEKKIFLLKHERLHKLT